MSMLHSICFIGTREISILHVRFTAMKAAYLQLQLLDGIISYLLIVLLCDPEIVTVLCNRYVWISLPVN